MDNVKTNKANSALFFFHADRGNVDGIRAELDAGVDVNARDSRGNTALLYAAELGNLEMASLLLNRGVDATARDHEGNSALMVASERFNTEMTDLLRRAEQAHLISASLPPAPRPKRSRL